MGSSENDRDTTQEAGSKEADSGWQSVVPQYVRLNMKEGIIEMSDDFEDERLNVHPDASAINVYNSEKSGKITFSFGSDDHGFEFRLGRNDFERIMTTAAAEWGYELPEEAIPTEEQSNE